MAKPLADLRVGLAQIDCRLGDVEGNLERHLDWIVEANAQRLTPVGCALDRVRHVAQRLLHAVRLGQFRVASKKIGRPADLAQRRE